MEKEKVREILEFIESYSVEKCPFCSEKNYPVKGDLKGWNKVEPYEAEGWDIDHTEDCPVSMLERMSKDKDELDIFMTEKLENRVKQLELIRGAICLLNSMVTNGEKHDTVSKKLVEESLEILDG